MKFELSRQAFYEAWKHFNLGTKPIVLNVLPEGILESERRAVERRAWDELHRLGFGNEMREEDICGVFLPLQRYERSFDVTFGERTPDGERKTTGMVANVRSNATLAVLTEESVRLQALPADSMVRALLSVLPDDLKAGPGRGVSLRSAAMSAAAKEAGSSDRAMADGLARQGVKRDDARLLVEMAGGERLAWAQFGAAVMDGQGKRHRAPMVTNFFATAKGWYMIETNTRGAEPWTTVAPIDKPRMSSRVSDLMKTF
ncbi:ESX secretion-associated protein EspG [Saccharopolyspora hirsuta]|uniref:ESX secretion-associated protein EspG n=1 Tax=Saccharopolyspora hirsuta TaxID=1837 RepID=A0A5M7C013_SACHI|nr:ESX secretion-associated protein EspG [Saccharopolyspora hirsuta]KAA5831895.1 ESX secretion-associated protein EspG [Saccharopolyspora hirsuta]